MNENLTQELISLKEEKLRIEEENYELKKENLQLKYIKDQFLPKISNMMTQVKAQNDERESKINFLESDFSFLRDQLLSKDTTENKLLEENKYLNQANQNLKSQINSLKLKYKHDIDDFSRKNQENEAKIRNLQSDIFTILQKVSQSQDNEQPNCNIHETQKEYTAKKLYYKLRIKELTQQNERYKKDIDQIKIQKQSLEKLNEEKQKIHEKSQKLILQSKSIIEKKNAKIQSLKYEISNLKKQQIQSQYNFTSKTNELNQKTQELAEYKEKISLLEQLKAENELKIKSLESINNQQQSKSVDMNALISKAKSLHDKQMKELIERQNKVFKEKEDLICNLKLIINKNQNEINKLASENANLNRQIQTYEEGYQKYKTKNHELKEFLLKAQESNEEVKNEIIIIKSNLKEKEELIEIKDKTIQELNEQINIQLTKQSKKTPICKFNDDVKKLNLELISLKQAYLIEKSKYKNLRDTIKEIENHKNIQNQKFISQLKNEIEMKNSVIEQLCYKIKSMNSEKEIDENEVENQNKCINIEQLNNKIYKLNFELKNRIEQNNNLILENEKLRSELHDLKYIKQGF